MDEHEQPITAKNTMFKELENLHFYVDDESEVSNEDGETGSVYLVHEDGIDAFVVDEEDEYHTSVDGEMCSAYLVDEHGDGAFVFVEEDESDFLSAKEGGVLLVDEGGEENFFVDEGSQMNYEVYGVVLTFDATYKKDKYLLPLVVFFGVNNHYKSTIFAATVVGNETEKTYVWVLCQFAKAMKGKEPWAIITDCIMLPPMFIMQSNEG
ncbi:MULE transposase domain [Sesbania bispinosa]|nr:MULE transposase domain [Sesbania bispinosa]